MQVEETTVEKKCLWVACGQDGTRACYIKGEVAGYYCQQHGKVVKETIRHGMKGRY